MANRAFGYDWMRNVYELDFEKEFEMPFKGAGWYQCRGDTMLVEDTGMGNALNSLYRIFVWNDRHPLDSVKDLPTFKF